MTIRLSDYLISPRDLVQWARDLKPRDYRGLALMVAAALVVGVWLGDISAALFAAGMVAAVWWKVDSRWPFGTAIALLVLIPLMQFAYNSNLLFSGQDIASGLAVVVWYLLAIGVVRQILELRHEPLSEAAEEVVPPAKVIETIQPARRAPSGASRLPVWRERLTEIEEDAASPLPSKASVDGVQKKRSK